MRLCIVLIALFAAMLTACTSDEAVSCVVQEDCPGGQCIDGFCVYSDDITGGTDIAAAETGSQHDTAGSDTAGGDDTAVQNDSAGTDYTGPQPDQNTADTAQTPDADYDAGSSTPDPEVPYIASVTTGSSHACALKESGQLYCWGLMNAGQIANGSTPGNNANRPNPVMVGIDGWKSISAFGDTTCGLKRNGEAYCWGRNANGQLANNIDGTKMPGNGVPQAILTGAMPNRYDELFAGGTTILAYSGNDLYGWGGNSYGQLATGQIGYSQSYPGGSATTYSARKLNGSGSWPVFKKIAPAEHHTCAIAEDDSLYCWGSYDLGQFGDGRKGDGFDYYSYRAQGKYAEYMAPVKIGTDTWKDITTLFASSCGIKTDGTLWCWGAHDWGQLGIGKDMAISSDCSDWTVSEDTVAKQKRDYPPVCTRPVALNADTDWKMVSGAFNHACAVKETGAMYCWGENEFGSIGNGTSGDGYYAAALSTRDFVAAPAQVPGTWKYVAAGGGFSCAIAEDKSLWCWGLSKMGATGITQDAVSSPRKVF